MGQLHVTKVGFAWQLTGLSNAVHFRLFPANFLNLVSKPCQAIPTQMPSISDPTGTLVPRRKKVRYARESGMVPGKAALTSPDASGPEPPFVPDAADDRSQPKVTGAKRGWFSLPHMHKSRLDFPEPDIQAVKRGFLPSMSAVCRFR